MLGAILSSFKSQKEQQTDNNLPYYGLPPLDPLKIPKHVAIIPDGNRRWAKKNYILPEEGHQVGAKTLLNTITTAAKIGIKTLTFFIFSTENWNRPAQEIKAQMGLLEKSLIEQKQNMLDNGVKFLAIGDLSKFPPHIIRLVKETIQVTAHCKTINVVFAMNYGGRDDLRRAFIKMIEAYDRGSISREQITENMISRYLDTADLPDPDLLIRTSGESRISNFLLWQLSYAELYTTKLYWPEFTPRHLYEAILDFQNRNRRLGA